MKRFICLICIICILPSHGVYAKTEPFKIHFNISKFTFFLISDILPEGIPFGRIDAKTSKGTVLHMLIGCMDYCQNYRISISDSFWKRIWLSISNMVRSIRIDFKKHPDFDQNYNINNAGKWGIQGDYNDLTGEINGREVLQWTSICLSEILIRNGIPRTLKEEIDYLKNQVDFVDNEIKRKFSSLSLKINKATLDQNWLYYIFALNHDLLPTWVHTAPDLGKSLTLSETMDYLLKVIMYCRQMAQDLEK